jgi:hypothetical protein
MTDNVAAYPVAVTGHIDPSLNRWRWLVKWFLAIPHLVILVFLWLAFVGLTVVAWFAVAITGRYPRGIFDFNVGVMRWTWRVEFYAFVFGTDRYPPFSLKPDPDYPAQLDVEYPERLSRGLVWVKSWLLAIPQYVIVAFFIGGAQFAGGLTAVLALVAAVALLFTRRYPASLFDFIMGMHRWAWRVAAYGSLMRDEYPPFRLDNGPDDPAAPPPDASDVTPLAA